MPIDGRTPPRGRWLQALPAGSVRDRLATILRDGASGPLTPEEQRFAQLLALEAQAVGADAATRDAIAAARRAAGLRCRPDRRVEPDCEQPSMEPSPHRVDAPSPRSTDGPINRSRR